MKVELISWTNNPIETVEKACSVCYQSEPSIKVVKHCVNSGHHSVLEFANFVFKIEDISRACSLQLVRHRTASFAQKSQRYTPFNDFEILPLPKGNGEKYHYNCKFDVNQEQVIAEMYKRGFSMNDLSHFYGLNSSSFCKLLERNGVESRTWEETKFINKNYFDEIDTPEKAYILGFIYSDGCIATHYKDGEFDRYEVIIDQLNEEDILLKAILREIKPNGKLIKSGHEDTSRIAICQSDLCKKLIEYGVTPKKGKSANPEIIFEKIPKEFYKDFIRGVFEGDGCLCLQKDKENEEHIKDARWSIAGTKDTCEGIQKILMEELELNKTKIGTNGDSFSLNYGGKIQVKKIIEYLYKDVNIGNFLHLRKAKKIKEFHPLLWKELSFKYAREIERKYPVVVPQKIEKDPTALFTFNQTMDEINIAYKEIIKEYGKNQIFGEEAKENARSILPNACTTTICVSFDLRNFAHFCNERLCSRAQDEIRKLAMEMKKAILSCPELDDEGKEIIEMICVPKCEAGKIKFCPEQKSCGRQKTAKEINDIISEIKNSRWKWESNYMDMDGDICSTYSCSICNYKTNDTTNYCPNCGSKIIK